MKLAIVSDMHLGYERFYDDAYAQACAALDQAAKVSDAILIPGDIFDMRNPKPEVLALGINLFRDLSRREWKARVAEFEGPKERFTSVPIIAIPGTHERKAEGVHNPVDLLGLAGLIVNATDSNIILEKGIEKVHIFSLGGIAEEKVADTLARLDPKPVENMFNIFMMHQSIYELLPFSDTFLEYEELPKGFDLYIDGHIHNKVEAKVHGKPFLIPGSTVLTQLKDGEQEQKGFFVFDTEARTYEHVKISSRNFVAIRIDAENSEPSVISEKIEKEIEKVVKSSPKKTVVRVIVEGELADGYKLSDLDIMPIERKYREAAFLDISKSELVSKAEEDAASDLRSSTMNAMSVKDYGMAIFLDKLNKLGYSLNTTPTELFEMLSSDDKKENVINSAIERLLSPQK